MSSVAYQPPAGNLLGRNPQLPAVPETPGGAPSDSEYQAQEAMLRASIMRSHNDILQQLGYMDDAGNFVPGSVEIAAQRSTDDLTRNADLARQGVTEDMQRLGTLFSGRRGTEQARAEHPFVQAMADLAVDVPKQLSQLYEQGSNLTSDYVQQRNLLLIDAAKRRTAALQAAPGAPAPPSIAAGLPEPTPLTTAPATAPPPATTAPAAVAPPVAPPAQYIPGTSSTYGVTPGGIALKNAFQVHGAI